VSDESQFGSRPVPDPTVLTTEALHREIAALRELVFERIARESEVNDEKFTSVEKTLALVETQRVEQKQDTKAAVDAALTAQKEAVKEQTTASERAIAKSETSTTKSIDQLGEKFDTAFEGQRRDVDDLKARVGKIESVKQGGRDASAALYGFAGFVLVLLTIVGLVLKYG
jgi:hypothetical protein